MANVDTWLIPSARLPHRSPGPWVIRRRFASGTAVAQNDVIRLFQIPRNVVVVGGLIHHSGTLGASAVATLRRQTTALTAATTAGGASGVNVTLADTPNTTDGTPARFRIASRTISICRGLFQL